MHAAHEVSVSVCSCNIPEQDAMPNRRLPDTRSEVSGDRTPKRAWSLLFNAVRCGCSRAAETTPYLAPVCTWDQSEPLTSCATCKLSSGTRVGLVSPCAAEISHAGRAAQVENVVFRCGLLQIVLRIGVLDRARTKKNRVKRVNSEPGRPCQPRDLLEQFSR